MEEQLSESEEKVFRTLFASEPNEASRVHVVAKLKNEGLIASKSKMNWARMAASLAIGLIAFGLGWILANAQQQQEYTYIMVLHEPKSFEQSTAGNKFKEYGQWAQTIEDAGLTITGEKLANEKYFLGNAQTTPKIEGLETLTGFFLISAPDIETAMQLANTSPHVKYGGLVELRKIVRE